MLMISEKIPNQEKLLTRLAALLNMTSIYERIQEDQSKHKLAGFYLLYEWDRAKDGNRNELVEALKILDLLQLAQM